MKRNSILLGATALAVSLSVSPVLAQSRWSQSSVSTANIGSFLYHLDFASANDSSVSVASTSRSFTGLDRNGNSQTMSFTGTTRTQSTFGSLHSFTEGSVTNTYYNASNPFLYNSNTGEYNENGSPDTLASLGFAGFTDTLQYGGQLQSGYKARYVFFLHGFASGHGVVADMSFRIDNNPYEIFAEFGRGSIGTYWRTESYDINGITPQDVNVQFSTQFAVDTYGVADGSDLSGTGNFMSTLNLVGIEVTDANGNIVDGWTVSSASGTQYNQLVPEPVSCAAFAIGGLGMLLRRRRREKSS